MNFNQPLQWLRWAGLLTTVVAGVTTQMEFWYTPNGPYQPWWSLAWFGYVATVAMFLANTRSFPATKPWSGRMLAMQMLLSVFLSPTTVILSAITIALVRPRKEHWRWMVALVPIPLANLAVLLWAQRVQLMKVIAEDKQLTELVVQLGLSVLETVAWCVLAFLAGRIIVYIEEERRRLASANAELTSSRVLLEESSRLAERLEISRELHDSLGHHLTTLNLGLELAGRSEGAEKDKQIRGAQMLARLLLADLRDTVGSWRKDTSVALPEALRILAANVTVLPVDLQIDDPLPAVDQAQAHALLRCCQEAVTNVIRHAAASRIWIRLGSNADGFELTVRDDGQGCPRLQPGNGLQGVRERLEEFSGKLETTSPSTGGFVVRVTMPMRSIA